MIGSNTVLAIIVGVLLLVIALAFVARMLMTHRHNLRLIELEAQEKIARAEREHLSTAERILELDDLSQAIRQTEKNPPTDS